MVIHGRIVDLITIMMLNYGLSLCRAPHDNHAT